MRVDENRVSSAGRVARVLAAVGSLLLAGACGGAGWRSLDSLAELKDDFNRDAGRYRVILLLSPT